MHNKKYILFIIVLYYYIFIPNNKDIRLFSLVGIEPTTCGYLQPLQSNALPTELSEFTGASLHRGSNSGPFAY